MNCWYLVLHAWIFPYLVAPAGFQKNMPPVFPRNSLASLWKTIFLHERGGRKTFKATIERFQSIFLASTMKSLKTQMKRHINSASIYYPLWFQEVISLQERAKKKSSKHTESSSLMNHTIAKLIVAENSLHTKNGINDFCYSKMLIGSKIRGVSLFSINNIVPFITCLTF